jgi:hypothetical protein
MAAGHTNMGNKGLFVLTFCLNTLGAVPQTVRGLPGGFGGQQQPQQPTRTVASRLPNGKMGECSRVPPSAASAGFVCNSGVDW